METKDINLTVSKETYELGIGLAEFIGQVKNALEDGWQPGEDLPVMLTSALSVLAPSLQGIEKIKGEYEDNPDAFANAVAITGSEIFKALLR